MKLQINFKLINCFTDFKVIFIFDLACHLIVK